MDELGKLHGALLTLSHALFVHDALLIMCCLSGEVDRGERKGKRQKGATSSVPSHSARGDRQHTVFGNVGAILSREPESGRASWPRFKGTGDVWFTELIDINQPR